MQSTKKVLVISHDANLNGAPILLLRLMRVLKKHGYSFNTILRNGGPLVNEFKALSDVCGHFRISNSAGFISKLNNRLRGRVKAFDMLAYTADVDFVLSNTITNGDVLKVLREHYEGPIISYVHELKMGEALYSTPASIDVTVKMTNHFLIPSNAVKQHLQFTHGIPEKKINLLNYYIPISADEKESSTSFKAARDHSGKFIVGGIGTIGWRKGADIFVLVAATLFKKMPDANIQFVWMGGYSADPETSRLNYDIEKLELQEKVVMVNASTDTSAFYRNISVLLLSSREDPYPLVVLEAAAEKVPTVCFENAGGTPEFVQDNAGTVVPYLDIDAMADALINYYQNNNLPELYGTKSFEKVKRLHQNKELIITQLNDALLKVLQNGNNSLSQSPAAFLS